MDLFSRFHLQDYAERGDENSLIIERILILIRNVLYVPANPDEEKRPDNDASLHDQVSDQRIYTYDVHEVVAVDVEEFVMLVVFYLWHQSQNFS